MKIRHLIAGAVMVALVSGCGHASQIGLSERTSAPSLKPVLSESPDYRVQDIRFSADGSVFAVGLAGQKNTEGGDVGVGKIHVYDSATRDRLASVELGGKRQADGSFDSVELWSVDISMARNELVFAAGYHAGGALKRDSDTASFLEVWSILPTEKLASYETLNGDSRFRVVANGEYLVYKGRPLNRQTGEWLESSFRLPPAPTEQQLNDSNLFAVGDGRYGAIHLWDLNKNHHVMLSGGSSVSDVAFSGKGDYLISSASTGGRCLVWQLPDPEVVHRCGRWTPFRLTPIESVASHPTENLFAVSRGNWVHIYSLDPFEEQARIETSGPIRHMGIANNQRLVMENDGTVEIWDLSDLTLLGTYETGHLTHLEVDPEQGRALTILDYKILKLLEVDEDEKGAK